MEIVLKWHKRRNVVSNILVLLSCCSLVGCASAITTGAPEERGACEPDEIQLVTSGRGLENEYYAAVDAGSRAFAESKGLLDHYQWVSSDGDSAKQLSQIKSILAQSGPCTVINVDANESAIVPAIIREAEKVGAWVVTQWNKPEGASPLDFSSSWVAHMSVNGVPQGYQVAKELFESMGGEGKIVALQGILDNPPAQERFAGLEKAMEEYSDIELLEHQTAGWDRTTGQNLTQTWLTAYGDEIDGIWAAGDEMALGAREALVNSGRAGEVPVTGVDGLEQAVSLVNTSDSGYVATSQPTGAQQGAYGLAIAYAAATGEIDPLELPSEKRQFYLTELPIVTHETAADVPPATFTADLELDDIWSVTGEGMD